MAAAPLGAADEVDATGCAMGGTEAAGDGALGGADDAAMPFGRDAKAGAGGSALPDAATIVDEGSVVGAAGPCAGADGSETTDGRLGFAAPTSSVVSLVGALALALGGDSAPLRLDSGLSANAAVSMAAHATARCVASAGAPLSVWRHIARTARATPSASSPVCSLFARVLFGRTAPQPSPRPIAL